MGNILGNILYKFLLYTVYKSSIKTYYIESNRNRKFEHIENEIFSLHALASAVSMTITFERH